eukprot:scpid109625/ scgid11826/ 
MHPTHKDEFGSRGRGDFLGRWWMPWIQSWITRCCVAGTITIYTCVVMEFCRLQAIELDCSVAACNDRTSIQYLFNVYNEDVRCSVTGVCVRCSVRMNIEPSTEPPEDIY